MWRILSDLDLEPWQSRSWLTSHDPDFWEKASDVCGLYLNPLENALRSAGGGPAQIVEPLQTIASNTGPNCWEGGTPSTSSAWTIVAGPRIAATGGPFS